jgi:hypothetical protein
MKVLIHLFEYRVLPGHEAELVGYVRHSVLPARPAGAASSCAARRLGQGRSDFIAVTAWEDEKACGAGIDADGVPRTLLPQASLLVDCRSSLYLVVASVELDCDNARILRIYTATVPRRDVEYWQEKAVDAVKTLTARPGLMAVQVGVGAEIADQPDAVQPDAVSVVALTAWRDWDSLIAATGGHLDRGLLETELIDLEQPVGADHYQMLEPDPMPS